MTFINEFKVRGGWGKTGNQLIPNVYNAYTLFTPDPNNNAYDISGSIDPTGFVATMFKGLLSLRTSMSWLEVFAYLSYIVIVAVIFLRPSRVAKTVKEEIKIS